MTRPSVMDRAGDVVRGKAGAVVLLLRISLRAVLRVLPGRLCWKRDGCRDGWMEVVWWWWWKLGGGGGGGISGVMADPGDIGGCGGGIYVHPDIRLHR